MEKPDIKSLSLEQLKAAVTGMGHPPFRARQIADWLNKGVRDFSQMTNLPQPLREQLQQAFRIAGVSIRKKLMSAIDGTVKYLFELEDGETIESVLMRYRYGWSQCLSTQVGCRMGCAFCATGLGGMVRNLTAAEMLSQIEAAQQDMGIRVSSVVLMGMGEPLDNYQQVLAFIRKLAEPGGVHIGLRHITLSTCGLVDGIYRLAEEKLPITLSVSLHAPNDALRSKLMPINRRWPVDQLLAACRDYIAATGRRVTFEYAMIDGVNDSDQCARELAGKLTGMLCHVNLIPVNQVQETGLRKSSTERIQRFMQVLQQNGIPVTVRRTMGSDINASCGQLRRAEQ